MSSTWTTLVAAVALLAPMSAHQDATASHIDDLVFSRLAELGITPAQPSSDAVFVRRVYLDVIGTLPTAQETWRFLQDQQPQKRARLIDHLLERPEFADYWAMKWSDVLRVKSEFPINLWPNATQAYHRWIRDGLRRNVPYDEFARDLLTSSGSNFRVPPVNFYRAVQSRDPEALARAVALTFMGERAEQWPPQRLAEMSVFFSRVAFKPTLEWKEEIVFCHPASTSAADSPSTAVLPDGRRVTLAANEDPRTTFARWLTSPENPWFARTAANRLWFWLLGRGIVHEPDDMRPDNPPSHPALLDWLSRELVASRYDLRHLYRGILNSRTYQLSSIPASDRADAAAAFAYYPMRPLDAEVVIDAINQITGAAETYSSAIPEPFTFTPPGQRAIALADGSITSPFLEIFGRSPRDTGLASERNSRPTAGSRLHLLNSAQIQSKLEQGRALNALIQGPGDVAAMVARLYLTILSRPPTPAEQRQIAEYYETLAAHNSSGPTARTNRQQLGLDVAWALINTTEFLHRH